MYRNIGERIKGLTRVPCVKSDWPMEELNMVYNKDISSTNEIKGYNK